MTDRTGRNDAPTEEANMLRVSARTLFTRTAGNLRRLERDPTQYPGKGGPRIAGLKDVKQYADEDGK